MQRSTFAKALMLGDKILPEPNDVTSFRKDGEYVESLRREYCGKHTIIWITTNTGLRICVSQYERLLVEA